MQLSQTVLVVLLAVFSIPVEPSPRQLRLHQCLQEVSHWAAESESPVWNWPRLMDPRRLMSVGGALQRLDWTRLVGGWVG